MISETHKRTNTCTFRISHGSNTCKYSTFFCWRPRRAINFYRMPQQIKRKFSTRLSSFLSLYYGAARENSLHSRVWLANKTSTIQKDPNALSGPNKPTRARLRRATHIKTHQSHTMITPVHISAHFESHPPMKSKL